MDPVDAHAVHGSQDVLELQVPCDGAQPEAVEEGDEATVPIGVVHVDGFDALIGQRCSPPLRTLFDPAQSGGVDQLCAVSVVPQRQQVLKTGLAQPEPRQHVWGDLAHHVEHGHPDPLALQVEREVELRTAFREQLREGGNEGGQLVAAQLTDRPATETMTHHAIVLEDRYAIAGQPDVALDAGGSQLEPEFERRNRVLGSMRFATPVGERDGVFEQ